MTTNIKPLILDVLQQDVKPSLELSEWTKFCLSYAEDARFVHLRFGQAFHQHFKLEKSVTLKNECDRIYYEPDRNKAMKLIFNTFDIS